jgi:hypothetical protein
VTRQPEEWVEVAPGGGTDAGAGGAQPNSR